MRAAKEPQHFAVELKKYMNETGGKITSRQIAELIGKTPAFVCFCFTGQLRFSYQDKSILCAKFPFLFEKLSPLDKAIIEGLRNGYHMD